MANLEQGTNDISQNLTIQSVKDKFKALGCFAIPLGCIGGPIFLSLSCFIFVGIFFVPWSLFVEGSENVVVGVLIIIAAIAVHFIANKLYGKQVLAEMSKLISPETNHEEEEFVPSMKTIDGGSSKQLNLQFKKYDDSATQLVDTASEIYLRDTLLNKSGSVFYYTIILGLVISLVIHFVILFKPWLSITSAQMQEIIEESGKSILNRNQLTSTILPYVFAFALLYFLNRVRTSVGFLTAIIVGIIAHLLPFIFIIGVLSGVPQSQDVSQSQDTSQSQDIRQSQDAPLSQDALASFKKSNRVDSLLLPILIYTLIVIVGGLYSRRFIKKKKYASVNGQKLLVLRVFGLTQNTYSLFGQVLKRWPLIGPVVTIADPTFAQFSFKRLKYKLIIVLAIPFLALMALIVQERSMVLFGILGVASYYLCWMPLLFIWKIWKIRNTSSRSLEGINQRLVLETNNLFRTRHASISLICYGDLWKPTMANLVAWTDMILMDLRGFQINNIGCKYELTYLMNNWLFDKTVFLTDSTTDASLFEKTIQEIAADMEETSPNAGKQHLIVHNYVSHNTPQKFRLEIPPLLALVGEIATSNIDQEKVQEDNEQHTTEDNTHTLAKNLKYLLPAAWSLLILGLIVQLIYQKDGMLIYSGLSIMWLGLLAILVTRRLRLLIIRDGDVTNTNFFDNSIWNIIFTILIVFWLILYLWIPLMN